MLLCDVDSGFDLVVLIVVISIGNVEIIEFLFVVVFCFFWFGYLCFINLLLKLIVIFYFFKSW